MLPRARIRETPDDFRVEEIPAYEPTGEGDHLFLRFTKRARTTDEAVRAIAGALDVRARDIGVAGLKDKIAVTTQTVSLPIPRGPEGGDAFVERARTLSLDGITVLDTKRHPHKLRTGHLRGNRFAIQIRGLDAARAEEVIDAFLGIGRTGLPNAFGVQRFGRDRDNAERARAWLSGRAPAPRDPRLRRLLWSALQSEMFNATLDARVREGTWATPLQGDLVKLRTSGGLFLCEDVQVDCARATAGELSPTGPMFGVKMRWPEGEPARIERQILEQTLGDGVTLETTRALGEGTRRALRLWVDELRVERADASEGPRTREQGTSMWVYFVLPKGAYATTVLSAAVAWESGPIHDVPHSDG